MTADELVYAAIGALVLLVGLAVRPQRATCPPGSYVEGVGQGEARPRGATRCVATPDVDEDCRGARVCTGGRPPRWSVPIRIYCTGGQTPVVVDERTVSCQARH